MSLSAAVAGLAGGYVKGRQIKADLEEKEQTRGLRELQRQSAELTLNRERDMADLSKQIGDKVMSFAPQSLDDIDAFDNHYNQLEGLLVKQASIAGKDPLAVKTQMDNLRREKYAERVFAATKMFETGNEAGFEILKPVYNRLFKDGNMLMGGTYNKVDDTFDIRYMGKGGEEKTVSVGREALVKQYLPMGLNTGDALKLALREIEQTEANKFQTGLLDKKLKAQAEEGDKDRANRTGIARMNVEGEVRAAGIRAQNAADREDASDNRQTLRDFQKGLETAFGYDPKFTDPEQRSKFNTNSAAATNIFRSTRDVAGTTITPSESVEIIEGIRSGTADVRNIPDLPGYRAVQVGSTRAVVPASMITPQK